METLRTPDERFEGLPGWGYAPHYLQVDGLRIHYVDEGSRSARPVLLLHGEPSWSYLYRKMIPVLTAAGHRVVAPDLVGFGRSDKPVRREDYTYQRHVDWLRGVLLGLDLEGVTLVCQDWGGLLGLPQQIDETQRVGAQLVMAAVDDAQRAHQPAAGQGHGDQGAVLHLAAQGRLGQQGQAGRNLDCLLDVLDVVELQYHVHVPMADALANPDSESRQKFYSSDLEDIPAVFVDGKLTASVSGPRKRARVSYENLRDAIDKALEADAAAKISQPGAMDLPAGVSTGGGAECLATLRTSWAACSRRCSVSSRCFISPPPSTCPGHG